MEVTTTIDKAGRIVLPKSLRDELHLEAGDTINLQSEGDHVALRPVRPSSRLRKDRGFWVFHTGHPLSAAESERAMNEVRQRREQEILNGGK